MIFMDDATCDISGAAQVLNSGTFVTITGATQSFTLDSLGGAGVSATRALYALVRDSAQNYSNCTSLTNYYLDRVGSADPIGIVNIETQQEKLCNYFGNYSYEDEPIFETTGGNIESLATVNLYEGSCGGTLVHSEVVNDTPTAGNHRFSAVSPALTVDGTYNYYISQTDPGNESAGCSGPFVFIFDVQDPTISSITIDLATDFITISMTVVLIMLQYLL